MNDSPRKLAYSLRPCDIPRGQAVHYVAEHREDKYLFFARNSGPAGLARVVPSNCYGRQYSDLLITSSVFRFVPIEDWVSAWVATDQQGGHDDHEKVEANDLAEACRILKRFVRARDNERPIESRYFKQAERLLRRLGQEW